MSTASVEAGSVVLNYTVYLNQSTLITPPSLITLTLSSQLYEQQLLSFDNGERTKTYLTNLPDGFSVDENDVASFKESILYRGEIPTEFFRYVNYYNYAFYNYYTLLLLLKTGTNFSKF